MTQKDKPKILVIGKSREANAIAEAIQKLTPHEVEVVEDPHSVIPGVLLPQILTSAKVPKSKKN